MTPHQQRGHMHVNNSVTSCSRVRHTCSTSCREHMSLAHLDNLANGSASLPGAALSCGSGDRLQFKRDRAATQATSLQRCTCATATLAGWLLDSHGPNPLRPILSPLDHREQAPPCCRRAHLIQHPNKDTHLRSRGNGSLNISVMMKASLHKSKQHADQPWS